jgi:hypothetical protein
VIARSDLPLGVLVAQTIHAAGESAAVRAPAPDTRAVALRASAVELADLEQRLRAAGVAHAAIREPDAPWCGALLAIGLAPAPRVEVAPFVRRFALVR